MEVCDDFGPLIPHVSVIVNNVCNAYLLSLKTLFLSKETKGKVLHNRDFCIIVEEVST